MSARALKKLHSDKFKDLHEVVEEDEDEDEEVVPRTRASGNAFDLLGEDTDDIVDEETDDQTETEPQAEKQSTQTKKKKNKKKNKTKASKASSQPKEDLDDLIKKFATETSTNNNDNNSTEIQTTKSIFQVDNRFLSAENELRRLFGKQTVKEAMKESSMRRGGRQQFQVINPRSGRPMHHHKKSALVRAKPNWPPAQDTGLSMEFLESKKGINYFKIVWNKEYQQVQKHFYQCVQTYDPNSFQQLLQFHPYHIDSLLQLSQVCNQIGEFETAMELIERAVFAFESTWHPMFNITTGSCRLEYKHEENKPFFLALFRYIQMLGREGTSRTAVEYCKLLLSLDLADPLFILQIIDYYCVRSQQYSYLIDLFLSDELKEHNLAMLPNFLYSVALAKFKLETLAKQAPPTKTSKSKQDKEIEAPDFAKELQQCALKKTSDELIQHALLMFPLILAPLVKKAQTGSSSFTVYENGVSKDLIQHPFFANNDAPQSLNNLVNLFVERNFTLWRDNETTKWLKQNTQAALKKVDSNDPSINNFQAQIKETYSTSTASLFNHLVLSEYTDQVAALPPEVANALRHGGANQLYEGFQEVYQQPQAPVVHATTNNPLQLFVQTLMPWNPVPNAPAVNTGNATEAQQTEWFNSLVQFLGEQLSANPQQEEEEDDDEN